MAGVCRRTAPGFDNDLMLCRGETSDYASRWRGQHYCRQRQWRVIQSGQPVIFADGTWSRKKCRKCSIWKHATHTGNRKRAVDKLLIKISEIFLKTNLAEDFVLPTCSPQKQEDDGFDGSSQLRFCIRTVLCSTNPGDADRGFCSVLENAMNKKYNNDVLWANLVVYHRMMSCNETVWDNCRRNCKGKHAYRFQKKVTIMQAFWFLLLVIPDDFSLYIQCQRWFFWWYLIPIHLGKGNKPALLLWTHTSRSLKDNTCATIQISLDNQNKNRYVFLLSFTFMGSKIKKGVYFKGRILLKPRIPDLWKQNPFKQKLSLNLWFNHQQDHIGQ
jgi:hypothetical protein